MGGGVFLGEGVGRGLRNKAVKYEYERGPESPLSTGPKRPRYATGPEQGATLLFLLFAW